MTTNFNCYNREFAEDTIWLLTQSEDLYVRKLIPSEGDGISIDGNNWLHVKRSDTPDVWNVDEPVQWRYGTNTWQAEFEYPGVDLEKPFTVTTEFLKSLLPKEYWGLLG